jgi:hypothetical protein
MISYNQLKLIMHKVVFEDKKQKKIKKKSYHKFVMIEKKGNYDPVHIDTKTMRTIEAMLNLS